jgi:hypothetical protein
VLVTKAETQELLDILCTKYGFCLAPADQRRIVDDPPPEVRAFTDAVFTAEGLDPEGAGRHLYRQVREMVAEAFRRGELRDDRL